MTAGRIPSSCAVHLQYAISHLRNRMLVLTLERAGRYEENGAMLVEHAHTVLYRTDFKTHHLVQKEACLGASVDRSRPDVSCAFARHSDQHRSIDGELAYDRLLILLSNRSLNG